MTKPSGPHHSLLIFTDGACSGNPGPGGWGAIILSPDGRVRELGGGDPRTTNNRMELSAVIAALRAARGETHPVRVYTDSTYVISGITRWVAGWRRKGWTTMDGKPVANRELWEELEALASSLKVAGLSWRYVRGHAGSPGNERCDEIAVAFSRGKHEKLYSGPLSGYSHDILDLPKDVPLPKAAPGSPKEKKGGYYLSLLAGKLERHLNWPECQARVHGRSGARFKKVSSREEEEAVLRGWGVSGPA